MAAAPNPFSMMTNPLMQNNGMMAPRTDKFNIRSVSGKSIELEAEIATSRTTTSFFTYKGRISTNSTNVFQFGTHVSCDVGSGKLTFVSANFVLNLVIEKSTLELLKTTLQNSKNTLRTERTLGDVHVTWNKVSMNIASIQVDQMIPAQASLELTGPLKLMDAPRGNRVLVWEDYKGQNVFFELGRSKLYLGLLAEKNAIVFFNHRQADELMIGVALSSSSFVSLWSKCMEMAGHKTTTKVSPSSLSV